MPGQKLIQLMWGWVMCCMGGGNYYQENIQQNSIITSQSTLKTKSNLEYLLYSAYLGTLEKDLYSNLPLMSKCHSGEREKSAIFLSLLHPTQTLWFWIGDRGTVSMASGGGMWKARLPAPWLMLEKNHWNQNFGQGQTEKQITTKNIARKKKYCERGNETHFNDLQFFVLLTEKGQSMLSEGQQDTDYRNQKNINLLKH